MFFTKLRRLRSEIDRQGFGRVVLYFAARFHIPTAPTWYCVRLLKICWYLDDYLRRRADAGRFKPSVHIDSGRDYLCDVSLPGIDKVVSHCRQLFKQKEASLAFTVPYTFITTISTRENSQFIDVPEEMEPIVAFAAQREVVEIVADYMREVPVLSVVSLIYTPVNDGQVGPQKFHRDMNCSSQVHLIVNIEDVDEEAGPFTFLPGDISRRLVRELHHVRGRLSDDEVRPRLGNDALLRCIGPSGSAFFVNPYACLHYGARSRGKPRYILILNYTSRFEWGEGLASIYRSHNRQLLDNGDTLRRYLLAV
jgi:hypothetical protein